MCMRLGVIADIHGNDVALRAILEASWIKQGSSPL